MATILSVDDELNPLILRKMLLEKAGHHVICASSGAEALRLFDFVTPDLVLTDQVMQGMTGVELAEAIRARNPRVPIIIISGLNEVPQGASVADSFLSKLEGSTSLLRTIEIALALASSSEEVEDKDDDSEPRTNSVN